MAGTDDDHDWMTLHRVRLKAPRDGTGNPFPAPQGVICWRFYPDSPIGETGIRTSASDTWGGFAIHSSREAAEAAFAAGDAGLPFADEVTESWHALVVPIRHHGAVKWRDGVQTDTTFRCAPEDPGGPLMTITSAGYENPGPDDLPRITDFLQRVEEVRRDYTARPENRRVAVFSGAAVDGHDGMTMSIWEDLPQMMTSAYRTGPHKGHMESHRAAPIFDRSSFTRLRVLASSGSWDGDPVEGLA